MKSNEKCYEFKRSRSTTVTYEYRKNVFRKMNGYSSLIYLKESYVLLKVKILTYIIELLSPNSMYTKQTEIPDLSLIAVFHSYFWKFLIQRYFSCLCSSQLSEDLAVKFSNEGK